jgi:hypothetical protein
MKNRVIAKNLGPSVRPSNPILPEMSLRQKVISAGNNSSIVWMLLLPLFVSRMVVFLRFVGAQRLNKRVENRIRNYDPETTFVDPLFRHRYLKFAEAHLQLGEGYLDFFEEDFRISFNILFQEEFFRFFPVFVEERIHEY